MILNFNSIKIKLINLIVLSLLLTACDDGKSNFTVTPDTIIKPGSELTKYITQEEIQTFSFRYWDIHMYKVENNSTMENLRQLLISKNTEKILNFMNDNNISVDTPLHYGVTPLMYTSFYNDKNTTQELIKLGADVHKKDKYGLSPMAYAISMNCIDVVKILLEQGVKFEEVEYVQGYLLSPGNSIIKDVKFYDDRTEVTYFDNWYQKTAKGKPGPSLFDYFAMHNLVELARIALESGYRPYDYCAYSDIAICSNSYYDFYTKKEIDNMIEQEKISRGTLPFDVDLFMDYEIYSFSLYHRLSLVPNNEKMLDLLLEYDIGGQPTERMLKAEKKFCISTYKQAVYMKYDMVWLYLLRADNNEIQKLFSTDVAKMNYEEVLKEFGGKGLRFNDKQLDDFNDFSMKIRDFSFCSSEDHMGQNFKSIGDIYRWASNKDENITFTTKEYVKYESIRNIHRGIYSFLRGRENLKDPDDWSYVDRNETKPGSNVLILR